MTCIAGYATGTEVYMAGDSAGASYSHIQSMVDPKVFRRDGLLIGYTSTFRMGQILKYGKPLPNPKDVSQDRLMGWICTEFVDALRKRFDKAGHGLHEDHKEHSVGNYLVGAKGRLFKFNEDYGVIEDDCGINAVGSGYAYALGAMQVLLDDNTLTAKQIVERAVKVACIQCPSVCEPITVEVLE